MKYFPFLWATIFVWMSGCGSDSNPIPLDKPVQKVEDAMAFPGAEGFGSLVTGGRGGTVIYVTNLNDAGAGSLRAALQSTGPRFILFKVSGTIALNSSVNITSGNVTIAGHTAPGDGITIKNHPVTISADNIIIRFMRFRMGDQGAAEADALGGRYRKNIIIDHCSMSWSTDECASFYGNENFTLQWCILSESLRNSIHEKGLHGYGGIWGGKNASFHHNLIAHHDNRNPRFDHPGVYSSEAEASRMRGTVDFRNNIIYNWQTDASYGGESGAFNMVANYYKPGPATSNPRRFLNAYKQATSTAPVYGYGTFYVAANHMNGQVDITANNWLGVVAKNGGASDFEALKLSEPLPVSGMTTSHSALQAYEAVLKYGGANFAPDAVDQRILTDVRNGTYTASGSNGSINGIIDSQADVGGWPELNSAEPLPDADKDGMPDDWETLMKLDPAVSNANGKELSSAYDNIEVYLNSIVAEIVENQNK